MYKWRDTRHIAAPASKTMDIVMSYQSLLDIQHNVWRGLRPWARADA